MLNPFKTNDAYNTVALSVAFQEFSMRYGRLTQLENVLWRGIPVRQREIFIERDSDELVILPTREVDDGPSLGKVGKRDGRGFKIPRIPHIERALAKDVSGIRAFGTENELEAFDRYLARKFDTAAQKHDLTLEAHLAGMINGILLDADGSTIYNFFTEWGVSEVVVNCALDVGTTDVRTKILEAKSKVEDAINGNDTITGYWAPCDEEFFFNLIKHDDVKEAYARFNDGERLRDDPRTYFPFAGVTFEVYKGKGKLPGGTTRNFLAANSARLLPLGTRDTFVPHFAPMESIEFVNTDALRRYVSTEEMPHGKGTEILTEQNPLCLCTRPKALVKLTGA